MDAPLHLHPSHARRDRRRTLTLTLTLALPCTRRSWDSYLGAPGETDVLSIATYMQSALLPFGYEILTVDEGWSTLNGSSYGVNIDSYGRYTPRVDMYPSAGNGNGFRALADQVHAMGLKFGVWTIRGIPRLAADNKMPIFNSTYTADQASRPDNPCGWDDHAYGCAEAADGSGCNEAAWAYYRSLAQWYADQHIDLVKLDCMFPADHAPQGSYDADDWAMTTAFREAGLDISLSPGRLVSTLNGSWVSSTRLADQYRVSEDFWDTWFDHYVSGLRTKLDLAVTFAGYFGLNGTYPDLDMLQVGRVMSGQHPPLTQSNLTLDEQRMVMSLWSAAGAPLIFGGRLPLDSSDPYDAQTLSLITNPEVLAVHNASSSRMPVVPLDADQTYAWTSVPDTVPAPAAYISLFNGDESPHVVALLLANTSLPAGPTYCARDLWARQDVQGGNYTEFFSWTLRPHESAMFLLTPCPGQ
jgi:alpha-galactosidase